MLPLTRLLAAPRSLPLLMLFSLVVLSHAASAATFTVPAQYTTIQAAINASQNGDTVLISDGTYTGPGNVDLDFGGRNITVTSVNGATSTILDCGGSSSANHRGFYLHSGETSAVINGLTIQNGYESGTANNPNYGGGAELSSGCTLTLMNCIFSGNTTTNAGGGLYNNGGALILINSTLNGNNGGYVGGGVCNYGKLTLSKCIVAGNTAISGGGVCNYGSFTTLTNCVLSGNAATGAGGGGGVYSWANNLTLINCTLTGNTALYDAGGIYFPFGVVTLINDILYGDAGGEIGSNKGSVTATNCDVQGGPPYGGIGNINADPLFSNSPSNLHLQSDSPCRGAGTVSNAPTTDLAGSLRPNPPSIGAYEFAPATATNTTLMTSLNPAFYDQAVTFTASVVGNGGIPTGTVAFVVDGNALTPIPINPGVALTYSTPSLTVGTHNIIAIYSGDSNFASSKSAALIQTVNPPVSPLYVSPAGSDSNLGTQAAPKLTIQAGINAILSGDTVIVEDGTYIGSGNVDLDFGGRNITVTSQNGATRTIIDCGGSRSANHRGFYLHIGETGAVISGLTIQNGYVDGNSVTGGGAIYNSSLGTSLQNCIIKNNTAAGGGGIYNSYNGTIAVVNCAITGNTAFIYYGGGIENDNSNNSRALTVTNCTFTGNSARSGGGIYNFGVFPNNGGTLILANDILYGDTGGEIGGGSVTPNYCDIQGGYPGTGNISADPLFVNTPTDLHLQASSPCLGAGNSLAPGYLPYAADFQPRPNPPSIGAFELETERLVITNIALSRSGGVVTLTANINNYGNFATSMVRITQAKLGAVMANGPLSRPYVISAGGVQPITLTFTTGASGRLPLSIKGTSHGPSFSTGKFISVP